ncbi:vacuolar protein sorting-associated protein VTA1 homolog [Anopheles bellator]|uniref:vacuolar protein sorting-associated protein VTA1 homolog n=1 Tax=Anopheles bellator TaxID=139047 RepID=UPI002649E824|nr:vacuolar protein sorting-associated protein VTA1 homolog [Anopheles bellator]
MATNFPPVSALMKPIQHYLKTAQEHDGRDPIVAYWCRLYALQMGLKIANQGVNERKLLLAIMDWLETTKTQMSDNESVTNEVAAQAYLENYALKLFLYADKQDRASNFGKNVVKAFYTAGMIYDVCQIFGELTEEVTQNRKYAKWKASYIHNCLKNGETPVPGPMPAEEDKELDNELEALGGGDPEAPNADNQPGPSHAPPQAPPNVPSQPTPPTIPSSYATTDPFSNVKAPTPPSEPEKSPGGFQAYTGPGPATGGPVNPAGVQLRPEQLAKAQKYCRWAESALNYEDLKTSIDNLQKALRLLQTGQDG